MSTKTIIVFDEVTFDIDKFSAISIDEGENIVQIALYLENSRHVIHTLNNLKSADNSTVLALKLLKSFYDNAILSVFNKISSNKITDNCFNMRELEKEVQEKILNLVIKLEENSEYRKANQLIYNATVDSLSYTKEEVDKAIELVEALEKDWYTKGLLEIKQIFNKTR